MEIINFLLVVNIANTVGSLGLILDVVGVILLFVYGLPSKIHTPPKLLLESGLTEKELAENKKIEFWARTGLVLIGIGFILQIASQWLR